MNLNQNGGALKTFGPYTPWTLLGFQGKHNLTFLFINIFIYLFKVGHIGLFSRCLNSTWK